MRKQKTRKPVRHRPPTPRLRRAGKRNVASEEKPCKHQWAALMAKCGTKIVTVLSAKVCLKCGLLKIGVRTIKISRYRLDMGDLPINNASEVIVNSRLKVPVGTDMYN